MSRLRAKIYKEAKIGLCFSRYQVEWIGREGLATETHCEYLQQFCRHFYKGITKLVDRAMRKEDSSPQGQIIAEILQHLHACSSSVKVAAILPILSNSLFPVIV